MKSNQRKPQNSNWVSKWIPMREITPIGYATVNKDGFEGILYLGNGDKNKVVIVVSGSNGGMKTTADIAAFYHINGIPALAVAMFNTKQTTKGLDRVPIEYIENAIIWLKQKGYQKIGMDGMSKGSELTLICASMFSDIACVIVRVPSYFVSEGLIINGKSKQPSGTSCWSYRGVELPFTPYKTRKIDVLKLLVKYKEIHLIAINGDKDVTVDSIIPVENIKAPVLILTSVNDAVWPSYESGQYREKRLREHSFSYPYKHIAYKAMSHAMLIKSSVLYKIAFRTERQNMVQCNKERLQLKRELLSWVNKYL
jgi:dienelactone hydrolase